MRESGILMHITSLPGPYGVGTMGKQAYRFVDFLQQAGQHSWQILPLNPTGYGDSPYQSCSAYAGNHYLIDLDTLAADGLLLPEEIEAVTWNTREDTVDFGLLYANRLRLLRMAYERFSKWEELDGFCRENSSWIYDFALFLALKDENGGKPWHQWPDGVKHREPEALEQARARQEEQIRFYCFVQYLFYQQWFALRSYANQRDIRIIGDVPIYVPLDSAEVWTEPELFQLDQDLNPTAVAGCPPDAFSQDGQLWGNPLYRWEAHARDGYGWWIRRLGAAGKLYDVVRLDHFRGFEAYWAVPYGEPTAKNGKWIKGPDMDFVRAVKEKLPHLKMIAEDLGFLTQEVLDLRDSSGFPGMKVLQFAFDSREPSDYLPHTYIQNTVCYTGTHDNMTMRQWFDTAEPKALAYAVDYMNLTEEEGYVWGVIRTAQASVSDLCIVPIQDYLDLGAQARMNFPGTVRANWVWRAEDGCFTEALAKKIYRMTTLYGRHENKEKET